MPKSAENPYKSRIFEDTKGIVTRGFSRPPRYDRFDNPPYMKLLSQISSDYSIFLEIFLEMRFCDVSEVPEKSVFTRLFDLFATDMLANFQDRLVMTASLHSPYGEITLRMATVHFSMSATKSLYHTSAALSRF